LLAGLAAINTAVGEFSPAKKEQENEPTERGSTKPKP
jgi:hypothetical protein